MLEPADQCARNVRRHRGHQPQPVGRQPWRQQRHPQDARALADDLAEREHHLLVTHVLGTAGIEDTAHRRRLVGDAYQVVQQVLERDRRRLRLHPLRRHHQRQVVDEVAHHLVCRGTGTDDDARADLGDRDTGRPQHLAAFRAGPQVLRIRAFRHQPAQIDDALDAHGGRGIGEIQRGFAVEASEVPAGGHRVDQVVGDATARQRVGQACRLERVRFAQLDSTPAARLESAPLSCDRAHAVSGLLQFRNKVRSDVAARPEDHGHTAGSGQRRRRVGLDGRHARAVYGCALSGCLGRRRFGRGRLRFAAGPIACAVARYYTERTASRPSSGRDGNPANLDRTRYEHVPIITSEGCTSR